MHPRMEIQTWRILSCLPTSPGHQPSSCSALLDFVACDAPKRLSLAGENVSQMSGGNLGSQAPTGQVWAMPAEGSPLPVDIIPQRPKRKTVIFTPVPQTFTSGFSGLLTMKSAKARHSLSAPEPTSKPSTG